MTIVNVIILHMRIRKHSSILSMYIGMCDSCQPTNCAQCGVKSMNRGKRKNTAEDAHKNVHFCLVVVIRDF